MRPRVLGRYLRRHAALRLLLVALVLLGLGLMFDLLDASEDILRRSDRVVADLFLYVALRLPSLVSELFGFLVLLGGLFTVIDLFRHRELVVMWAAGLSPADLARHLLPFAALLAVSKFLLDDRLVPPTAAVLREWDVGRFSTDFGVGPGRWVWVEIDGAALKADAAAARERRLERVELFLRDEAGRLRARLVASRAEPVDGRLRFFDATLYPAGPGRPERFPVYDHPGRVDLAAVQLMARPAQELALPDLVRVIRARGYGMRPVHPHRVWAQARFSDPLGAGALLLLPLALLRSFSRRGITSRLFAEALALGFLYELAHGFLLALGEGGFVPAPLAAWGLPLLLVAGLLLAFRRAHAGAGRLDPVPLRRCRPASPS